MTRSRILIADDNPLALHFFVDALAGLADCIEASDGPVAVERARVHAFDLLLLDARMPTLGGVDTLAAIRAQGHAGVPALATTADDDATTRAALLAAGFAEVLIKPLGVDALRGAVSFYLDAPESGNAAIGENATDFDDGQALAAAGGDASIVIALRTLFAAELDALPDELDRLSAKRDAEGLRERLHRLDASAGFCGAPSLLHAAAALRATLDQPEWPRAAVAKFQAECARIRAGMR
jgi:CheY-like chemotaxis protein